MPFKSICNESYQGESKTSSSAQAVKPQLGEEAVDSEADIGVTKIAQAGEYKTLMPKI